MNSAFVFIKPHAVTEPTKALVKQLLEARGITIVQEGDIAAKEIDSKKMIDQHYYAIASKATLLKPEALNVPADKFRVKFGVEVRARGLSCALPPPAAPFVSFVGGGSSLLGASRP
jgi:hypothetical protein